MDEIIRLGRGSQIIEVPRQMWEGHVFEAGENTKKHLNFMNPLHHQVRYFVVDELVRNRKAIPPETISQSLNLPLDQTIKILDDLERNLTFLFRNREGAVVWAYPVTVEKTPHRLRFESGKHLYGA